MCTYGNSKSPISEYKLKKSCLYFLTFFAMTIAGCANPEYSFRSDKFLKAGPTIKQIVVLPFGGEPAFGDEVADLFAMQLLNGVKSKNIKIIQPANAKVVLEEMKIAMIGGAQYNKSTREIAQLLHADAVVLGEVRSHKTDMTMNGFVTLKLIDTQSGEIIAASHKASGLLFAYSVHQCVVAAAENAGEDMISAINDLPIEKNRM